MKNIPTLRFPEFVNDGEWEEKRLGDIANKINSGKTPLGGESVYTEQGILFIRSQNVFDNKLSLENSVFIPKDVNDSMKNSIVAPNDILLNITGASLGRSCVVPNNFTIGNVNQHVCIVRLNQDNNPHFIQPIFSSEIGQNIFTSLQTGSGREGLTFQSIKEIKISLPSLNEQQKIADCLSSIDNLITAQSKKLQTLKEHKKALMQQLFPSNHPALSGTPPKEGNSKDENVGDNSQNSPSLKGWQTKSDGVVKSKTTQEDKHA